MAPAAWEEQEHAEAHENRAAVCRGRRGAPTGQWSNQTRRPVRPSGPHRVAGRRMERQPAGLRIRISELSVPPWTSFIVVGVDENPRCRDHLFWAAAEARRWQERLLVVRVVEEQPLGSGLGSSSGALRTEARLVLERDVATAVTLGATAEGSLLVGSPERVLVEAAEGATMLIVGSRHRGKVLDAVHNSVASHCIHHASCPVVAVPIRARTEDNHGRGGSASFPSAQPPRGS